MKRSRNYGDNDNSGGNKKPDISATVEIPKYHPMGTSARLRYTMITLSKAITIYEFSPFKKGAPTISTGTSSTLSSGTRTDTSSTGE